MINKILKENDVVFLEKLKTREMIENGASSLARNISNSNFSDIINKFKYKAARLGKKVYQVDTYYASSKRCSIAQGMKLYFKDFDKEMKSYLVMLNEELKLI